MKRLLTLLAVAASVLMAGTAFAAVQGTPHYYGGTTGYGECQVCHVPHAALTGKRLWRENKTAVNDGTWVNSTVGRLCGSCHNPGGPLASVNNNNGNGTPSNQLALAYATTSHKRSWTVLIGTGATDVKDAPVNATVNGKPYTSGVNIEGEYIECTSCHNPHNDGLRPFLRAGVSAGTSGFCADCHNRYNTNVGAANTQTWNGSTVSMHPVNLTLTDSASNGGATFHAPAAAMNMKANAITNNPPWVLGGKGETVTSDLTLNGTNNIGCATCHAIHNPAASSEQGNHLLAIDNTGSTGRAELCQGCHGGPDAGGSGGTSVGSAAGDHPINTLITRPGPDIARWVAVDPNGTIRYERYAAATNDWPKASSATVNIICTSCHSAHAGRATLKLTRTGGNAADWCLSCHADAAPLGHHSYAGNWGSSAIACTDCHGGGASGAHNGFSFTGNLNVLPNNLSQFCESCHLSAHPTDPVRGIESFDGNGPAATFGNVFPNGYLGGTGDAAHSASHYTGAFDDGVNSINVKRSAWWTDGGNSGYSKYGPAVDTHNSSADATGTTMVCESCHSVRWNAGVVAPSSPSAGYNINLLLQDYQDDGVAAGLDTGAGFCVACHNQTGLGAPAGPVSHSVSNPAAMPANMHPMTGWQITRAQDAGRTTTTLITANNADGSPTYADNGARTLPYPAVDQMNCDSCHRPHIAATNGRWNPTGNRGDGTSVILEIGPASVDASGNGDYGILCKDCHAY